MGRYVGKAFRPEVVLVHPQGQRESIALLMEDPRQKVALRFRAAFARLVDEQADLELAVPRQTKTPPGGKPSAIAFNNLSPSLCGIAADSLSALRLRAPFGSSYETSMECGLKIRPPVTSSVPD